MVEKHRAVPTKKKSVVNHGPSILADLARPRPVGTRTETVVPSVPVDQKKSPMPCLRKGWRLVRHGSKTSIWAMRYRGMDWLLFGMVLLFGMLQRDPGVSSQFAKVGEGYCASSRSVDVIPYAVTAAGYSSCASACYQETGLLVTSCCAIASTMDPKCQAFEYLSNVELGATDCQLLDVVISAVSNSDDSADEVECQRKLRCAEALSEPSCNSPSGCAWYTEPRDICIAPTVCPDDPPLGPLDKSAYDGAEYTVQQNHAPCESESMNVGSAEECTHAARKLELTNSAACNLNYAYGAGTRSCCGGLVVDYLDRTKLPYGCYYTRSASSVSSMTLHFNPEVNGKKDNAIDGEHETICKVVSTQTTTTTTTTAMPVATTLALAGTLSQGCCRKEEGGNPLQARANVQDMTLQTCASACKSVGKTCKGLQHSLSDNMCLLMLEVVASIDASCGSDWKCLMPADLTTTTASTLTATTAATSTNSTISTSTTSTSASTTISLTTKFVSSVSTPTTTTAKTTKLVQAVTTAVTGTPTPLIPKTELPEINTSNKDSGGSSGNSNRTGEEGGMSDNSSNGTTTARRPMTTSATAISTVAVSSPRLLVVTTLASASEAHVVFNVNYTNGSNSPDAAATGDSKSGSAGLAVGLVLGIAGTIFFGVCVTWRRRFQPTKGRTNTNANANGKGDVQPKRNSMLEMSSLSAANLQALPTGNATSAFDMRTSTVSSAGSGGFSSINSDFFEENMPGRDSSKSGGGNDLHGEEIVETLTEEEIAQRKSQIDAAAAQQRLLYAEIVGNGDNSKAVEEREPDERSKREVAPTALRHGPAAVSLSPSLPPRLPSSENIILESNQVSQALADSAPELPPREPPSPTVESDDDQAYLMSSSESPLPDHQVASESETRDKSNSKYQYQTVNAAMGKTDNTIYAVPVEQLGVESGNAGGPPLRQSSNSNLAEPDVEAKSRYQYQTVRAAQGPSDNMIYAVPPDQNGVESGAVGGPPMRRNSDGLLGTADVLTATIQPLSGARNVTITESGTEAEQEGDDAPFYSAVGSSPSRSPQQVQRDDTSDKSLAPYARISDRSGKKALSNTFAASSGNADGDDMQAYAKIAGTLGSGNIVVAASPFNISNDRESDVYRNDAATGVSTDVLPAFDVDNGSAIRNGSVVKDDDFRPYARIVGTPLTAAGTNTQARSADVVEDDDELRPYARISESAVNQVGPLPPPSMVSSEGKSDDDDDFGPYASIKEDGKTLLRPPILSSAKIMNDGSGGGGDGRGNIGALKNNGIGGDDDFGPYATIPGEVEIGSHAKLGVGNVDDDDFGPYAQIADNIPPPRPESKPRVTSADDDDFGPYATIAIAGSSAGVDGSETTLAVVAPSAVAANISGSVAVSTPKGINPMTIGGNDDDFGPYAMVGAALNIDGESENADDGFGPYAEIAVLFSPTPPPPPMDSPYAELDPGILGTDAVTELINQAGPGDDDDDIYGLTQDLVVLKHSAEGKGAPATSSTDQDAGDDPYGLTRDLVVMTKSAEGVTVLESSSTDNGNDDNGDEDPYGLTKDLVVLRHSADGGAAHPTAIVGDGEHRASRTESYIEATSRPGSRDGSFSNQRDAGSPDSVATFWDTGSVESDVQSIDLDTVFEKLHKSKSGLESAQSAMPSRSKSGGAYDRFGRDASVQIQKSSNPYDRVRSMSSAVATVVRSGTPSSNSSSDAYDRIKPSSSAPERRNTLWDKEAALKILQRKKKSSASRQTFQPDFDNAPGKRRNTLAAQRKEKYERNLAKLLGEITPTSTMTSLEDDQPASPKSSAIAFLDLDQLEFGMQQSTSSALPADVADAALHNNPYDVVRRSSVQDSAAGDAVKLERRAT
eukprot:gene11369-29130_t